MRNCRRKVRCMQEVIFWLCHRIAIDYYVFYFHTLSATVATIGCCSRFAAIVRNNKIANRNMFQWAWALNELTFHSIVVCKSICVRIEGNFIYCDVHFAWTAAAHSTSRRHTSTDRTNIYRNSKRTFFLFWIFPFVIYIERNYVWCARCAQHIVSQFGRPTILDFHYIRFAVCTPYTSIGVQISCIIIARPNSIDDDEKSKLGTRNDATHSLNQFQLISSDCAICRCLFLDGGVLS